MNHSTGRVVIAVLATAGSLFSAASASAASVKIDVPGTSNFIYLQGDQTTRSGEIGVCVNGQYFGGSGPTPPTGYDGDPCPARTGDTTLPGDALSALAPVVTQVQDAVTDATTPPDGGGGGDPAPPCTDQASCEALLVATFGCDSPESCQATYGGDGGGGGGPAPPCTDQASCEALLIATFGCDSAESCQATYGGGGGGGAPELRGCTSSTGGDAQCLDFGSGNYLVGDSPEDGQGELGFCTSSEQAPAGPGYYYITAPPPGGDAGAACPAAAQSGGQQAGGTAPPPTGGSGSNTGSTSPGTQQPPAEPVELPRVDITRSRLAVSRRGRVSIPLECQTLRTTCIGALRLTATRRTSTGRRVRVLLARASFRIEPGQTVKRKVRLTKAGRRLLAAKRRIRARARTALESASGPIVRRERVVLRRA